MIGIFQRFLRGNGGNVAIIFGITAIPVMVVIGGAIDYSRASNGRSNLQHALDAAALAAVAADLDDSGRAKLAKNTFQSNWSDSQFGPAPNPAVTISGDTVTVAAKTGVETTFLGLIGVNDIGIGASSTASRKKGGPACIIALNPSLPDSFETGGKTDVIADKCVIQVNSSEPKQAIKIGGPSTITSAANCFVGALKGPVGQVSPAPVACSPVSDPFASHSKPFVGGCDHVKFELKSDTSPQTLHPGVYCGGIKLSGKHPITFNPGIYIILDGYFEASVDALVFGNEVAFYLTGNKNHVDFTGGTDVHFSAPTSGTLAGFVFYADPNATNPETDVKPYGRGTVYYEGALYFPNQLLDFNTSNGTEWPSAPWTVLVADKIYFHGNGKYAFGLDFGASAVPVPPSLASTALGQGLVRLIN